MPALELRKEAPPGVEADHALIVDAAREAGAIARRYFRQEFKSWDKGKDELVTEADIAIDTMLRESLGAARPDYGWLSEETHDNPARLDKRRLFVVDPIDGTRGFIEGKPHFTVCIAAVEDGRPIAAAVYNPVLDEMYEAIAGGGARLNGNPIRPTRRTELKGAHIVGPRSMLSLPAFAEVRHTLKLEYRNSIAYRLVLVASGQFDATATKTGSSDWDIAAADLIVQEAGARLTTRDGAPFIYNRASTRHPSLLCAGEPLHGELIVQLRNAERR